MKVFFNFENQLKLRSARNGQRRLDAFVLLWTLDTRLIVHVAGQCGIL